MVAFVKIISVICIIATVASAFNFQATITDFPTCLCNSIFSWIEDLTSRNNFFRCQSTRKPLSQRSSVGTSIHMRVIQNVKCKMISHRRRYAPDRPCSPKGWCVVDGQVPPSP